MPGEQTAELLKGRFPKRTDLPYRLKPWQIWGQRLLIAVPWAAALISTIMGDVNRAESAFLCGGIFFTLLAVIRLCDFDEVEIDPEGVTLYRSGKIISFVAWHDVKEIRAAIMPVGRFDPWTFIVFSLHAETRLFGKALGFTDQIQNLKAAKTLLQHYADKYNIPIVDAESREPINIFSLPEV